MNFVRLTCIYLALFFWVLSVPAFAAGKSVYVRGYTKSDGTYVPPHFRSAPDGNPYNNWSYPGNVNPHTGKEATGNPDTYLRNYCEKSPSNPYCTGSKRGDSQPATDTSTASTKQSVERNGVKATQPVTPKSPQKTESSSIIRENLRTCLSGEYPILCKHHLLSDDEQIQVDRAEKQANFRTCISGEYPILCKHGWLTEEQRIQVERAEKRANFQTCISGEYPILCKHSWLTEGERRQVEIAEKRANLRTCISGHKSLCKWALLTVEERKLVNDLNP